MHSNCNHLHQRPPCPVDSDERIDRPYTHSASSSSSSVYLSASSVSLRSTESMPEDVPGQGGQLDPLASTSQTQIHSETLKISASAESPATSSNQSAPSGLNGQGFTAASVHQMQQLPSPEVTDPPHLASPPSTMSLSERLLSRVGKRRGTAGAYSTDNEGTAPEDSDATHSGGASSSTMKSRVRARLRSLKSVRSSGLSAEVRDASRLASLSASASLSNLRLHSPTSPKLSPGTTDSHLLETRISKETKRLRSQSVGPPSRTPAAKIVKRLSSGFQLHRVSFNLFIHYYLLFGADNLRCSPT